MTTPDDTLAPVALLAELGRARQALQRARRLPFLAVGRPARGVGGARGPGGELPWGLGRMPAFGPDGGDAPVTISPSVTVTVSPWPNVGHRAAEPAATPILPTPTRVAAELPRAIPHRLPAAQLVEADSIPPAAKEPAPPAERHSAPLPPPLPENSPGLVLAGQPRHDAVRETPPSLAELPDKIALPTVILRRADPATPSSARPPIHAAPLPARAPSTATPSRPNPAFHPTAPLPAVLFRDPPLPWTEPQRPQTERSSPSDPVLVAPARPATPGPAIAPTPSLVQRNPRAAPVSVSNIVALGESIQQSVRQELDELREMVTLIGKQSAPIASTPKPASPATGDAARLMLGRMRTMLQEEQFRRGNIR